MTTAIKTARIYHDHHHDPAHAQVSLDYDGRFLRRKMLATDDGESFLVDLAHTKSPRPWWGSGAGGWARD